MIESALHAVAFCSVEGPFPPEELRPHLPDGRAWRKHRLQHDLCGLLSQEVTAAGQVQHLSPHGVHARMHAVGACMQ